MIITCEELFGLTNNPRINDISLNLLREYYEKYLCPSSYQYEIVDTTNNNSKVIELRFEQQHFCHLLGIESILSRTINQNQLHQYRSRNGWNNIESGILDFDFLKKNNKKGFIDNKTRFVFFYLIPKVIDSPQGVIFKQCNVSGNTRIDCELMFYDNLQDAYVHIGIEENVKLGYYIPKTFLVEKVTPKNGGLKYVGSQQKINVNKL